jgi:hypothetical protein
MNKRALLFACFFYFIIHDVQHLKIKILALAISTAFILPQASSWLLLNSHGTLAEAGLVNRST